ncbi:fluoride efflux transporter FluC [Nocardiopsis coralliicola]
MTLLLIALGGGLGAAARFLLDTAVARRARTRVPLGTLVVNTSACLLLGLLTGWLSGHPGHGLAERVLATGFLGGFSTFSTASVETARLLLGGGPLSAAVHALSMLAACLAAVTAGLVLGTRL